MPSCGFEAKLFSWHLVPSFVVLFSLLKFVVCFMNLEQLEKTRELFPCVVHTHTHAHTRQSFRSLLRFLFFPLICTHFQLLWNLVDLFFHLFLIASGMCMRSRVGPTEVINCYLLSLAFVDLLCGLVIVPLSVYPALTGSWLYGDLACRFVGYLEVTLWSITVYTFMWISVDRYLAVRKPLRYETVQTKTRYVSEIRKSTYGTTTYGTKIET